MEFIGQETGENVHDLVVKVFVQRGRSLRLGREKAMHVLRSTPWILSYRTERSQVVLASLAVSLGESSDRLEFLFPFELLLSLQA